MARFVIVESAQSDLRETIARLAENPGLGHLRQDLTTQPYRFWPVDAYLIVYLVETDQISILRVLHGFRDIPEVLAEEE
ncbi:MAG: type II toxin-antitoxin system RelE/ParE family toxin [Candidatus Zixiibacteriota bacterium]